MIKDDLPLRYPTKPETDIFGGISTSMWMWSGQTSASTIVTCLNSQSFRRIFPIFFHRRMLVFGIWVQTLCGTYSSTQYVLNYTRLEAYFSFHINALVRINIVRRFYFGQNYKFYLHPRLSGGFNSLSLCRTGSDNKKEPNIGSLMLFI